jgi:hypothetical protein
LREWGANREDEPRTKIEVVLDGLVGDRESFRKTLTDAPGILRKVCRYAEQMAEQQRVEPWSIVGQITGHGSGVSNAIYELYRVNEKVVT